MLIFNAKQDYLKSGKMFTTVHVHIVIIWDGLIFWVLGIAQDTTKHWSRYSPEFESTQLHFGLK